MANFRLNVFENFSHFHSGIQAQSLANGTLMIQGIYMPGSISFNNVAVMFTNQASNNTTNSFYFGLYSLNGSTLSLANTASASHVAATDPRWVTLGTSATQDITPGNWYFAFLNFGAASTGAVFNADGGFFLVNDGSVYGGPLVDGRLSVSTGALPASIATSDVLKNGTSGSFQNFYPYILISA